MKNETITDVIDFEPERIRGLEISAWVGHLPFAHTLVKQFQPSLIVELGTHWGASYFTFCHAVKESRLSTVCYAVDTWEGERHSGHYGESVYETVSLHNENHYRDFSQLLQKTFDQAIDQFRDESIDLLHLDGLHTYDAVSSDFSQWWPKVKPGGVVLLHDICCRHQDFGVWKLWEEIQDSYPLTFSFLHGYGLGVLVKPCDGEIHPFLKDLLCPDQEVFLRTLFRSAGTDVQKYIKLVAEIESLHATIEGKDRHLKEIQADQEVHRNRLEELQALTSQQKQALALAQEQIKQYSQKEPSQEQREEQAEEAENVRNQMEWQSNVIHQIQNSLSWKLTKPLRCAHRILKPVNYRNTAFQHFIDQPTSRRIYRHSGSMTISGWCFHTPSGKAVDRIFIQMGGQQFPYAQEERVDVAEAFGLEETDIGFRIELNPGHGIKYLRLLVEFQGSILTLKSFLVMSQIPPLISHPSRDLSQLEQLPKLDDYETWCLKNKWNTKRRLYLEAKLQHKALPVISIIMPVFNPTITYLKAALESLEHQVYTHWELCIADDCSTDPEIRPFLEAYVAGNSRVKTVFRPNNGHISAATNTAAEMATGDYFVFLDQDDTLTPDALAEVALFIHDHPGVEVLYSDDDKIDEQGIRFAPQFKPDWSPELLLSFMYFGHLFCIKRELYHGIGGARVGLEGSQDYDIALRATEKVSQVGHIPKILYHWRAIQGSTASGGNEKAYSFSAGIRAVQDALDRRKIKAEAYHPEWAIRDGCGYFTHRFGETGPSVGIVIPTKNQVSILSRLLTSLESTTYKNYNIYLIDNDSDDKETLDFLDSSGHRVFRISNPEGGFNYSFLNNNAVSQITEEFVLFLNNDTEVIRPDWLSQMVGYLQIEGVAAVGARLLYPNNSVQHAGVIHGLHGGLPGHAFKQLPSQQIGYMGLSHVLANYSGVTAACMLIRREEFLDIGGFDADELAVTYNDVDLCYRLLEKGRRIVYAPSAELYHHESYSRGSTAYLREEVTFLEKYRDFQEHYYNPNFSKGPDTFRVSGRSLVDEDFPLRGSCVGFFTHNLNLEGAPIQLLEIAVGLKERYGIRPILFSCLEGSLGERAQANGIEVVLIPPEVRGHLGTKHLEAIKHLTVWVNSFDLSAIIANTVLSFWAVEVSRNLSLKSLWIIHESDPPFDHLKTWDLEAQHSVRECLGYAYQNIFVSEATQNLYIPFLTQSNSTVIHNGLCPEKMELRCPYSREEARIRLGLDEQDVFILTVGTVCERKSQSTLLDAAGKLSQDSMEQARFAMVGKQMPKYKRALDQNFRALPLSSQKKVSFYEETWDIGLYFRAADIFVCSSKSESYPKIILEAMYCGIPILTTPVFGIQEQVKDGVSARFFPPDDDTKLASLLEELISNPDERMRLATNAKLQLECLTDYDEMILAYRTLLAECFLQ